MAKGTVNKVILLGRLGAEPEIRQVTSGGSVANIRLATNDGYKDRQTGQFVEQTEWHRVVVFGRQAEVIQQYVHKGDLLYLEGRIRTNKWTDQSGQDRYTTEIVANNIQLMGGGNNNKQSNDFAPIEDTPYAKAKGGMPSHNPNLQHNQNPQQGLGQPHGQPMPVDDF